MTPMPIVCLYLRPVTSNVNVNPASMAQAKSVQVSRMHLFHVGISQLSKLSWSLNIPFSFGPKHHSTLQDISNSTIFLYVFRTQTVLTDHVLKMKVLQMAFFLCTNTLNFFVPIPLISFYQCP